MDKKQEKIGFTPDEVFPGHLEIPTVLIDSNIQVFLHDQIVRINLFESIQPPDPTTGQTKRVVAKLAMPTKAFVEITKFMNRLLREYQQRGVL